MTRIVVVGATGNVGTALLRRFRDAGADVVGMKNTDRKSVV